MSKQAELSQWFTPRWASEALREQYLPLGRGDVVCDPTCGNGSLLAAVPDEYGAFGVEIDPDLAEQARANTGRTVVTGDFRTVAIPMRPTVVFGNPPFRADAISAILRRCFELLPWDGRLAMILPAYAFQTSSTVIEYHARWSMDAKLLPRNLFPGLSLPLIFVQMRKSHERRLSGFALHEETGDVTTMPAQVRATLSKAAGSVWFEALDQVLRDLGGEATLDVIYATIEPKRPTQNQYWREKCRQVLQHRFERTAVGRYARRRSVVAVT